MALPSNSGGVLQTVAQLAQRVRRLERARRPAWSQVLSSGQRALDELLGGGFRRGALVEWLARGAGSGAATLALLTAARAARDGGAVVVVDRQGRFYPPAAANLGIELGQLVVVRPTNDTDQAWAFDQVLGSPGVAAVWGEPGQSDDHTLRRWQLAAEASGTLGLLVRDERALAEPSWAQWRLLVEPIAPSRGSRHRRLRVELVRSRMGLERRAVELEIAGQAALVEEPALETPPDRSRLVKPGSMTHETRGVHLASPLAAAAFGRRSRRA